MFYSNSLGQLQLNLVYRLHTWQEYLRKFNQLNISLTFKVALFALLTLKISKFAFRFFAIIVTEKSQEVNLEGRLLYSVDSLF